MLAKFFCVITLATAVALVVRTSAQVQTEVPPPVPGAKPVAVQRIKVHGTALEGNLEGDAVDRDVIVVLPDSKTLHNGSMYSSSITTGDFEQFIAHDLVTYIDGHYRTIPNRMSRGLVGHSMGGYGATRIGMKHADVFGSLYIMSPCCLSPRGSGGARGAPAANATANDDALAGVKTPADSAKLPFGLRAQLASAAAWSPNPKNPPLYLDLPIGDQQQT